MSSGETVHKRWTRDSFVVSCAPADQDVDVIHAFLVESYWAKGVPRDTVARSIRGSLCFALLDGARQVGFARVISDRAMIAYLADVFVLPDHRGRGLGTWLVQCVLAHPELQGMRRWLLGTRDAHGLYRKLGFTPVARPDYLMEIRNPNVYAAPPAR
ncbi:MAG TPA: GNAT family N-acetyltransferase [Gammaproteobacteria bacterium]|nr:GNAT family N-acetyltransferase [Gammaproteobacteria bacterium]